MPFSNRSYVRTILIAALLLTTTRTASAQRGLFGGTGGDGADQKPIRVVVDGGLTVPSGEFKARHQNGFHYGAMLILTIPGLPIAIRPEVALTSFQIREPGTPSTILTDARHTKTVSGLGNIEVLVIGGLYVMGGGGFLSLKSDTATLGKQLSASNLMLDVGGGFRFKLGERIDGFLEARVGTASFDKKKFGYSRAQFVPLSFGLVF